ncbi:MAG TPA: toll/interleukin-1 receptor domain-containing protein [Archangium sp.]|uniref:tetratricopeptide repeat protein n=1 Tax=Archangium sp. TaxID=1872627 RepID=UPI002E2EE0F3|nr:toll/interleukin-1 receptor domain-containing protein [Archangium sp.]HEX5745378.1 toll/interleukin-1 receptor domain-containing protein [Archangium sp.]
MSPQVFISYARGSSLEHAKALQQALGADVAFLDTSSIEVGERFPSALADALLGSRVIVAFADELYFTRWYCLWELRAALTPFLALSPNAPEVDKSLALSSLVLALPAWDPSPGTLERLPPPLRAMQWPRAEQTEALVQWIRACLAGEPPSLESRLEKLGRLEETRESLLQSSALPPPRSLAGLRLHPLDPPPSIGASFVGREDELWRIDFALTSSHVGEGAGAALSGALEAAGGFGKTRLALEYLHRLGPLCFPGGLFWVDADVSDERLEEQHHDILRTLNPGVEPLPEFRKQQRNAARELAQALHTVSAKERVLFVVDNVPETPPGQSPRPLKTWCPAQGRVALLVTSRVRRSLGNEGLQSLPVPTLAPDASVALLTQGVDRSSLGAQDWHFIADWVGHLPLALELLNRAMHASAITPAELFEKSRHVGPTLELDQQMEALRPHIPEGQLRGVTEALSISFERLTPEAQRAAEFLAHLSPAPIPIALLDLMKPLFTPPVRSMITVRSFVTGATGGRVPMFGAMHRVLADFIRSRSQNSMLMMEAAGTVLARFMSPAHSENPEAWPLLEAFAPHAEWLFERLKASLMPAIGVDLGSRLGTFRAIRGWVRLAAELRQAVAERARESLGEEHLATLSADCDRAESLRQQGRPREARELLEKTLQAHLRLLGEDHPGTLILMNNLSLALADLHDPGARPLAEHVLEARLRLLGEEHQDTLHAMNNLATILWDLDDVQGSRAWHERVLSIRQRTLGETHPLTLLSKTALATTIRKQGDLGTARAMQEALLEAYLRVMGKTHPETLVAMKNLATTAYFQSDLARARELQEEALVLSSQVLGAEHPSTLSLMTDLVHTLEVQKDQKGTRELHERILSLRRQRLGEHHPQTRDAWADFSSFLREQRDFKAQQELHEEGVRALEKAIGRRAPDTVFMAWGLFVALNLQDKTEQAQQVLDQYLRWLLKESPASLEDSTLQQIREQLVRLSREVPKYRC